MRAAEESRLPDCHGLDSTPKRQESAVLSTISDLRCSGLRSMNFPIEVRISLHVICDKVNLLMERREL